MATSEFKLNLKLPKNLLLFALLLFSSSAWALGRMGPSDPPSFFYYTFFYLCPMLIGGGIFIDLKVSVCYGFFIPQSRSKNLLKINCAVTALLAVLFSTMQGNIRSCVGKNVGYLSNTFSDVNSNTALLVYLLMTLIPFLIYFFSEVVVLKRNGYKFEMRNFFLLGLLNLGLSSLLALMVASISIFTNIYSGSPVVYFPFGDFCKI